MKRRNFIKSTLVSSALYGVGGFSLFNQIAHASVGGFPTLGSRVLVDLMLHGGPNLRHLMPPPYESDPNSFGYRYWQENAQAHNLSDDPTAWEQRWENDYYHLTDGTTAFGLLKEATWLKTMWDQGFLAIVNNVIGSNSRDHSYCQMIKDQGNVNAGRNDSGNPGWGGKLAYVTDGNVLALTSSPRNFCFGPNPNNLSQRSNANVISAADTRTMRLYHPSAGKEKTYAGRIARSLRAYYAAKREEIASDSIYKRFTDMESKSRKFGDAIDDRLSQFPIPSNIEGLYTAGSSNVLNNRGLGKQIRNLYDSLAVNDIVNLRAASLAMGGWDTHKDQKSTIEKNFSDLFGTNKAFDALSQNLPAIVRQNSVLLIGGEFGRQLKANGNNGTDHGRGTSFLVIGDSVNGGIYGNMYPEAELARLDDNSPDITGLTEYDHIFAPICDWIAPNSGSMIFPNQTAATLETGVDLTQLFI
ncbi:DUF1501 domain-containing protein [Candidatus Marithrix sp. Canyon 246]|uniref:DUF1501 domain-containing protein n=1 Tax=Candidatus Marithrix sp. Canyon 246 TaxID=1827136 RepID=UPI00084A2A0D|nr:DUF1501 domain-containing protein [Candidatus Marithrix sp. Canyon 246]